MVNINLPYYAVLGLEQSATRDEIRRAYRRLVKTMHPDAGGDPEAFVELNSAYNTLIDPRTREIYDLTGDTGDFNPLTFQKSVIESIADAFQALLSSIEEEGYDIDSVDFMTTMKNMIEQKLSEVEDRDRRLKRRIIDLKKLHKRITRTGEEKNIFAEIISQQAEEKTKEYSELQKDLRIIRRCLEEIYHYSDIGDLLRTVQAGRYPGQPGQAPNFRSFREIFGL